MIKEKIYYNFKDILKWLGFYSAFEWKKEYPFTKDPSNVSFSWGQILIPSYGIYDVVKHKIKDTTSQIPINELHMMYNVPFLINEGNKSSCGIVNNDISLTFKYDKQHKYGNITKSIYEVCFYILEHAIRSNDFYLIVDTNIMDFMSYFVINNQWVRGAMTICSTCSEIPFATTKSINKKEDIENGKEYHTVIKAESVNSGNGKV